MAHTGQTIANPRTGQRMTFVELGADELCMETVNPATSEREPLHVHPRQESGCAVVSGSLVWEVDGIRRVVGPGERVVIPPGRPHRFWNEGPDPAVAQQFFRPALKTAAFFEAFFDLAARGQLDARGMPRPLPLAALVAEYGDEIRPVRPPWPVLRALSALLLPFARRRLSP